MESRMIPGFWFECTNDVPVYYYKREKRKDSSLGLKEIMINYGEFAILMWHRGESIRKGIRNVGLKLSREVCCLATWRYEYINIDVDLIMFIIENLKNT